MTAPVAPAAALAIIRAALQDNALRRQPADPTTLSVRILRDLRNAGWQLLPDTTTEPFASHLADAATAAGLTLPHAIDCSDGQASVHTRPASMGEWQQWCDLVHVDGSTLTTKNAAFTYGKGEVGGYRITLYGHGVPGLRWAATTGRPTDPTRST